ncbi:MAG: hypothetical protein M3069_01280 [Chloroflexota bacterium]|nr:hypothetical protein [Chloroflexota bacterium]
MVDEGRSGGAYGSARPWEDRGGRAAGTILATAIGAAIIAFMLRRSREEAEPTSRVAKFAREFAGSDNVEAGRDFLMDKVLPELKPALLSGLSEIEDVVDQAFRRIEKNIKKL